MLHPAHHLVGRQRAAGQARQPPVPIHLQARHRVGHHRQHLAGAGQPAEQGLLEKLEVAVVAAGELGLEGEHRGQVALDRRGARPGELEEVGVPLVGHDAGPGGELGGEPEQAVLFAAPEHHVGGELAQLVPQLGAPEEGSRLELAARVLDRGHIGVEAGESQRSRRSAAPEGEGHTVPRRAPQRGAVHLGPEPA